jgi:DNA-binding NarL/FixJ family response regulator
MPFQIVLYSDRPARELRSLALNCGADAYVAKNADFANVTTIIRQLLKA